MKKIISTALLFVAVFLILLGGSYSNKTVNAQNSTQNTEPTQDVLLAQNVDLAEASSTASIQSNRIIQMPSVSVDSVNLNKEKFKAGEEISGFFEVTNRSTVLVENSSYRLLIGENYQEIDSVNKVTESFLDATNLFSLGNIKPGETKKVNFVYKVPTFLYGEDLAVQINVYTNNAVIIGGNSSKYINIEKSADIITLSDAKLVLGDGKTYTLTEGPTIYGDKDPKTVSLSLKIKNENKGDIAINPKITTYNQQNRLSKVETVAPTIRLKTGESKVVSIELPTMDYVSAVYFSEIMLVDAQNGAQLASRIGARYIIGGDLATVHSVQTDRNKVKAGESINISYVVTGKPDDISQRQQATTTLSKITNSVNIEDIAKKDGQINVKLINELDQLVTEVTKPFDLSGDNRDSIDLVANEDAKALKAIVSVYNEEGFAFLTKEIFISGDYETIAKQEQLKKKMLGIGSIVLLVLVVLAAYIMFRRKKIGEGVLSLVIIFSALAVPTVTNAWIYTGTTYNCSVSASYSPQSVTINTPYDNQVFVEGGQFSLSGAVYFTACTNSSNYQTLNFHNPATGESGNRVLFQIAASGGHSMWSESRSFYTKLLNVGSKAGYNTINFYLFDGCWKVSGYVPYYVQCQSGRVRGSNGYCTAAVNGVCGVAGGKSYGPNDTPSTNYCTSGIYSNSLTTYNSTGYTYSWRCVGNPGTTASCSFSRTTSGGGSCGTANGKVYTATQTPSTDYCTSGTYSNSNTVNNATGYTFNWKCTSGGVETSCSFSKITATTTTTTTTTTGTPVPPTTVTPTASCGTQNNTSVSGRGLSSGSSLCGSGSSLSGSLLLNYKIGEWRWTCAGGGTTASCKAACDTGKNYCATSNSCSTTCTDWCPNITGLQTNRNLYNIDETGNCSEIDLVKDFKLNPSISNSQGVCKALWTVYNPTTQSDGVVCRLNNAVVSCINTTGVDVLPGVAVFEARMGTGTESIINKEELRCTQNPNLIEI